jgi:hypothetical protein
MRSLSGFHLLQSIAPAGSPAWSRFAASRIAIRSATSGTSRLTDLQIDAQYRSHELLRRFAAAL